MTIHFDTTNNLVTIQSDEVDIKGRPTHEWEMNTLSGKVWITKRSKDGSEIHTKQKQIDPSDLVSNESDDSSETLNDTAYKILTFFIIMIIAIFSLLYAYFKVHDVSTN